MEEAVTISKLHLMDESSMTETGLIEAIQFKEQENWGRRAIAVLVPRGPDLPEEIGNTDTGIYKVIKTTTVPADAIVVRFQN